MNSIGTRLALVISMVLLLMVVIVGLLIQRQLTEAIEEQGIEQAEVHAQTLLGSLKTLMLNGSGTLAREWLDRLHGVAGIKDIEVLRRDGTTAFTDLSTVDRVNSYLGEPRFSRDEFVAHVDDYEVSRVLFERALKGEHVHDVSTPGEISVAMPIEASVECLACHGYDQLQMRGVLFLSLSTTSTLERISAMRSYLWGGTFALVTLLGLALWISIRFNVLKPLSIIRDGIKKVSEGDREARVEAAHNDELGELANQFNQMQDALVASENRTRAVMDNVVDGVMTLTASGQIETVNPAVERIFGYKASELIGQSIAMLASRGYVSGEEFILGKQGAQIDHTVLGAVREVNAKRRNGTVFPIDVALSEMHQAGQRYFIAVVRDITSRKARTAALRYQAMHDALTDLPNRTLLLDRLQYALRTAQRAEHTVALIIMDLDRFKEVNDTLGHHVGDKLLQQVAKRLRMLLRQSDTVARLGGDEFSVLLPEADEEQAVVTAKKIIETIDEPIIVEGQRLNVGLSLGIAVYPQHGDSAGLLMQRADVAMYLAKRSSNYHYAIYDPELDPHSLRQLAISNELRTAIEEDQLVLHYQPKIDLATGGLAGVEALVRWQHPKHGLLYPDEFVPLAEQTGLMRLLSLWVVEHAVTECMPHINGMDQVRLSLNLSMSNLQDPGFADDLAAILKDKSIPFGSIKLEITETALMEDPSQVIHALRRIKAMGLRVSIDDFGTGYSSLTYLKQLPVSELKIDKSFGQSLVSDGNSVLIVRSTIDLAHKLGLRVVAEGVESRETLELLAELGCDSAQGFYVAKPMPKGMMSEWLMRYGESETRLAMMNKNAPNPDLVE